jgi:hypothetical protein
MALLGGRLLAMAEQLRVRQYVNTIRFPASRIDPAILESCADLLRVSVERVTREHEEDLLLDLGWIEPLPRHLEARAEVERRERWELEWRPLGQFYEAVTGASFDDLRRCWWSREWRP